MDGLGLKSKLRNFNPLRNRVACNDTVGAVLAGENDHGHPAAGVGAAAGEVEVFILGGSLWRFESVVALPVGDDAVNRASVGAIHFLNIDRSEEVFDHDAFTKAFDAAAFHFVEATFFECDVVVVGDARAFAEGRNVREDFDVVATFGSFGGISPGGGDHVEGGVFRELLFFKDRFEVLMLVFRKEEVVVGELRKGLVGAEVEDNAGAGGGEFLIQFLGKRGGALRSF